MKSVITGFGSILMLLLAILIQTSTINHSVRAHELNTAINNAIIDTQRVLLEEQYTIPTKENYVSEFTQNLLQYVNSNSDISIQVHSADPKIGLLDVTVVETYKNIITKEDREYRIRRTSIIDREAYSTTDEHGNIKDIQITDTLRDYLKHIYDKNYVVTFDIKGKNLELDLSNIKQFVPKNKKETYLKIPILKGDVKGILLDDNQIQGKVTIKKEGQYNYLICNLKNITKDFKITIDGDNSQFNAHYSIHYDLKGGQFPQEPQKSYSIDSLPFTIQNPIKKGYTFICWRDNVMNQIISNIKINQGDIGNRSYSANWKINEYTITTHLNGGFLRQEIPQKYTIESKDILLPIPTREGYQFEGWYDNKDFNDDKILKINHKDIEDKDLYAKWSIKNYNIHYILNGGQFTSEIHTSYNLNDKMTLPLPNKVGYEFEGWYDNAKFSGSPIQNLPINSIGDKTYYAKWTDIQYNIKLISKNKLEKSEFQYSIENGITLPIPKCEGYIFEGWYDNEKYTGQNITSIKKGSIGDKTLYAKWNYKEYHITYHLGHGEILKDAQTIYHIHSEDIILPQIAKEGYQFEGWYDNPEYKGSQIMILPQGSQGDKIFYAKWKRWSYQLDKDKLKEYMNQNQTSRIEFINQLDGKEKGQFVKDISLNHEGSVWAWIDNDVIYVGTNHQAIVFPENCNGLFKDTQFTQINFGNIDMSQVKDIRNMFKNNPLLEAINFEVLDVSKVKDFSGLFEGASALETVSLENIHFESVENVSRMFKGATNLSAQIGINSSHSFLFNEMFEGCSTGDGTQFIIYYKDELYSTAKAIFDTKSENSHIQLYKDNGYKVTLHYRNGRENEKLQVTYYDKINTEITKEGYLFLGWYDNEKCEGQIIEKGSQITSDCDLYAKWELQTYNIHYETNPGYMKDKKKINKIVSHNWIETDEGLYMILQGDRKEILTDNYLTLSEWDLSFSLQESGYLSFRYIFDLVEYNGVLYGGKYTIYKDGVLYKTAKAQSLDESILDIEEFLTAGEYKIVFEGYSFDTDTPDTSHMWIQNLEIYENTKYKIDYSYTYEDDSIILSNPIKEGYTFEGWYDNEDFKGDTVTEIPTHSTGDKAFYAKWRINQYTITYSFDGGVCKEEILTNYTINDELILPVPEKEGYIFQGWYNVEDFSSEPIDKIKRGTFQNLNFYAKWKQL